MGCNPARNWTHDLPYGRRELYPLNQYEIKDHHWWSESAKISRWPAQLILIPDRRSWSPTALLYGLYAQKAETSLWRDAAWLIIFIVTLRRWQLSARFDVSGWDGNEAGKEVEVTCSKCPVLSLFWWGEEPKGGDTVVPYALHSYRSMATPYIDQWVWQTEGNGHQA